MIITRVTIVAIKHMQVFRIMFSLNNNSRSDFILFGGIIIRDSYIGKGDSDRYHRQNKEIFKYNTKFLNSIRATKFYK